MTSPNDVAALVERATPRPWTCTAPFRQVLGPVVGHVYRGGNSHPIIINGENARILGVEIVEDIDPRVSAEANATLIVEAVNSYDALRAEVATQAATIAALQAEVERAKEDERDRLLALAEARQEKIEAITDRCITSAEDREWCDAVEIGCFLEDQGAMLPAARSASRKENTP